MSTGTAGSIIIDIVAKTGELQTDVDRAQSSINKLQRELQKFQKETAASGKEFQRTFIGPLREGETAINRFNGSVNNGVNATRRLNAGMQQSQAGFRSANLAIQNTSYQITDFVMQVSGGVDAMRAFSQQAPQLLGGFGPMGALAGMVVGLAAAFGPMAVEAIKGVGAIKDLNEAQKALDKSLSNVGQTASTFDLKNVIEEFNKADVKVRESIVNLIRYEQELLKKNLLEAGKSLNEQLADIVNPSALSRMVGNFDIGNPLGLDKNIAADFYAEVKSGTTEATILFDKYGIALQSGNEDAQKLGDTLKKIALDTKSAANAGTEYSKFLQQAQAAGSKGQIAIPGAKPTKADNTLEKMFENQRVGADKFVESMLRSNEQIQFQTSLLGRSAQEVEVLNAQYRIEAELQKTIQDLQRQNGTIAEEEMARMTAAAQAAIAIQTAAITSRQEKERTAMYGMESAMRSYTDSAGNMAKNVEQTFTNAFKGMEDAIVQFALTGKGSFADFANAVISDIMRIYVRMAITGLIGSVAASFTPGLSSSPTYMGPAKPGTPGAGYADGGYTGDGGKYQPAGIVHAGEFVMTKEATSRIGVGNLYRMMRGYADGGLVGSAPMAGGANGGGNVTINVKNEAGADGYQATATARKNETGYDIDILVRKALTNDLRSNGPMTQTIGATFGLRRSA